jgi:transcriptional regulator with XRE-family HTH domain
MAEAPNTGGARVAILRKARNLTQRALARRADISLSLLSKIEVGDRALTPDVAAALAEAMRMTLGALYGEAELTEEQDALLRELRTAVRRYDIADQTAIAAEPELHGELSHAIALRERAELDRLLRMLPGLLTRATTYAHSATSPAGWALLADVYSVVYALAARYRWMDLVEIAPARQAWAASQHPNPLVDACAVRDRAGTFLNCGDFDGGIAVIDRAIAAADAELSGPDKAFATGTLHLRGMTLAGRLKDRPTALRHIRAAQAAAEEFPSDVQLHNQIFGRANTATHVLATEGDLGRPREVLRVAEQLADIASGLPPTRLGPVHINTARARLDLADRDGAEESLLDAWDVAPQMARIHPMSLEVLRVLISLHRRSKPGLVRMAREAGLSL